jgi:hypothetical protein
MAKQNPLFILIIVLVGVFLMLLLTSSQSYLPYNANDNNYATYEPFTTEPKATTTTTSKPIPRVTTKATTTSKPIPRVTTKATTTSKPIPRVTTKATKTSTPKVTTKATTTSKPIPRVTTKATTTSTPKATTKATTTSKPIPRVTTKGNSSSSGISFVSDTLANFIPSRSEGFEPMVHTSQTIQHGPFRDSEIIDKFSQVTANGIDGVDGCVSSGLSNAGGYICLTPDLIKLLKTRGGNASGL